MPYISLGRTLLYQGELASRPDLVHSWLVQRRAGVSHKSTLLFTVSFRVLNHVSYIIPNGVVLFFSEHIYEKKCSPSWVSEDTWHFLLLDWSTAETLYIQVHKWLHNSTLTYGSCLFSGKISLSVSRSLWHCSSDLQLCVQWDAQSHPFLQG